MSNQNENLEVWQHPDSGEVLLSPQLQEEIQSGLNAARIDVQDKSMQLVQELGLTGQHRPDYLAAAVMEAGIQHAVAYWGPELVIEKLRELVSSRDDLLDAVLNTASSIALDRVVNERLARVQNDN